MIFETLYESSKRGELLLIDGGGAVDGSPERANRARLKPPLVARGGFFIAPILKQFVVNCFRGIIISVGVNRSLPTVQATAIEFPHSLGQYG